MKHESHAAQYICYRTSKPPRIDGRLDDPVWKKAPQTQRFVDMVTGDPGWWDTRASLVWDESSLYISFRVEEPFVEALQTERDSLVFLENDVEVFIDGGDCYYEFEINALGTIYEVFFVWQDAFRKGSRFDVPEFDLHARKALSFAGNEDRAGADFWKGTHPRGPRWAFLDWDFPGLEAEVEVDGTINDRSTVDRGWSVELAFPWAGMKHLAAGRSLPPKDGDVWKLFLGRFQKLTACGREIEPHPAWCATPHGIYDTHMPERWTRVQFSSQDVETLR